MSMAYLTQEVRELDQMADWRVIEAIEDVRQYTRLGDKEVSASSLAKRLGFSGPRQQTRVSDLSGGERRRLQFLRLLLAEPNVLHPRRADQRPRHRDADLVGGRAGRLGRHPARRLARPLPARADVRPAGRAARRRCDPRPARRGRAVPRPARRGEAVGGRGPQRPQRCRGLERVRRRHPGRAHALRGRGPRGPQGAGPDRAAAVEAVGHRGADPRRHGGQGDRPRGGARARTTSCAPSSTSARRSRWSG